jgi:hypothetical protein
MSESENPAPGERERGVAQSLALWRRRLVADQALAKVTSIIRVRRYELATPVEASAAGSENHGAPERAVYLRRARELVEEEPVPDDRRSANQLLDRLDAIVPLVADDPLLCLMLEDELDQSDGVLGAGHRRRAERLLGTAVRCRLDTEGTDWASMRDATTPRRRSRIGGCQRRPAS